MIEKKTQYREYPKPDVNNFLQDDVKNIENALDKIDEDVNEIKLEQTAQNESLTKKVDESINNVNLTISNETTKTTESVTEINNSLSKKAEKTEVEQMINEAKKSIEAKLALETFIDFSL